MYVMITQFSKFTRIDRFPSYFHCYNVSNVRHQAKDMQHSIYSIYQLKRCTLKLIIAVLFQSHWEIENKLEVAEKCRWTRIDKMFPPIRMYNSSELLAKWMESSVMVYIHSCFDMETIAGTKCSRCQIQ